MIGDDLPDIPDVVEAITAVRCWQVRGPRLYSINGSPRLYSINGTMWLPRQPLTAICKPVDDAWNFVDMFEDHPCPGPPLSHGMVQACWTDPKMKGSKPLPPCGIYGFKDITYALRQYKSPVYVWGEVLLWGRVWPSTDGYRAEHAQPVRLYRSHDEQLAVRIEALSNLYALPIVPHPLTADEAKQATGLSRLASAVAAATRVVTGLSSATRRSTHG